jgi:outer membrane protein OmpA-like peptidoglycan-associated protein
MKTTTLAIVLVAAFGCGSKAKPKTTTTTDTPPDPVATKPEKPVEALKDDKLVSPGLGVSGDIVALCGIKVAANTTAAAPKFEYDQYELTAEDRAVLDQIATCLTSGPLKGKAVSLIGRADPRGTEEYNMGLGSRRSHSVGQYLGRLGVSEPQMLVTTRGAIDAKGTDESTWREDRRVDIQLAQN